MGGSLPFTQKPLGQPPNSAPPSNTMSLWLHVPCSRHENHWSFLVPPPLLSPSSSKSYSAGILPSQISRKAADTRLYVHGYFQTLGEACWTLLKDILSHSTWMVTQVWDFRLCNSLSIHPSVRCQFPLFFFKDTLSLQKRWSCNTVHPLALWGLEKHTSPVLCTVCTKEVGSSQFQLSPCFF